MRLEHVGLNVADPIKAAQWYVDNLGMKVLREAPAPANTRFLGDAGGNMMLEIYHNPPEAVPNYAAMDPLLLHVAFMVDDVEAMRQQVDRRRGHRGGRDHDHAGRRQARHAPRPLGPGHPVRPPRRARCSSE